MFEAKYFGECGGCEEKILPGESVEYRDGYVCHVECDKPPPRQFYAICPKCYTEKPATGICDNCD